MAEALLTAPETKPTEGQAVAAAAAEPAKAAATAAEQAKPQQQQEAKVEAKPEQAKPAVPEKYEFKQPEGQQFDSEVLNAYSEVAKELQLSQEAAQKVLDKVAPVMHQRQLQQIEKVRTEWVTASKSDKEFGGDKLPENLSVAKKALDKFGTPELRKLLEDTGLGNHPEIIRAFYRAGKGISEDAFVVGSRVAAAERDPAKVLYPNMA